MSGLYGDDLAAIHAAGFTGLAEAAAGHALELLPAGARVVDLGCGDGTTAGLLTAAGHEVVGIDGSQAAIALARRRAPRAAFRVGDVHTADLGRERDAILAVGEVLGYLAPGDDDGPALGATFARLAGALRPGGMLLFDLAGPGRVPGGTARTWAEGEGWAVLVDAREQGRLVERRIVTFRRAGGAGYRRDEERHRLRLHDPAEVLGALRGAGLAAHTVADGYAGAPMPPGLTVYLARREGA